MKATATRIDWSDVEDAAKAIVGNWQRFSCFCWHRGYDLPDSTNWMISYTSGRDAGLLAQSNEAEITKRLAPFLESEAPDIVAEVHSHFACGWISGFSIRVYRDDGSITPAFEEWCRIQEELDNYPVLSEQDWSEREFEATLDNYTHEMWRHRSLPEGWQSEVYSWFSDHGLDRYIESRDDSGGYADEAAILEALRDLGLVPTVIVDDSEP